MNRSSTAQAVRYISAAMLAIVAVSPSALPAQQVNVQTPFRSVNDGFFEQVGGSWGLNFRNGFFRMGGGPAVPPFGGANPNAGIGGGVGFQGGGVNGGFNFMAAQGSRRSNVMQSGSLTLTNGYPGVVSDTSVSPFVIGIVPVVNDGFVPWQQQMRGDVPKQTPEPAIQIPLRNPAAAPSAPRNEFVADPGLQSVAELRQQRAGVDASREKEVLEQMAKAREAEAAGKPNVARIFYQMAARRAEGELQQQVQAQIQRLDAERARTQR